MAKKKKKIRAQGKASRKTGRGGYLDPVDYVLIDGVQVSLRGTDRGPDHLWMDGRDKAEDLALDALRRHVVEGEMSRVIRVDNLERLYRDGEIGEPSFDAGRRFQYDFYLGHFNGFPAPKFEWVPASTVSDKTSDACETARFKMAQIVKHLGGANAPKTVAAFKLIGECVSLNSLHTSGSQRAKWKSFMLLAIADIADFYSSKKKRS